jgi:acetyl esterase
VQPVFFGEPVDQNRVEVKMAKKLTREQNIKKAKQIRQFEKMIAKFQHFFLKFKGRPSHREFFFDTEFGRVRALAYGFENIAKTPIFFDMHGGGFILGGAVMDETMNIEFSRRTGCKIISIDYAKAPDHPYPAAVNQVHAVVKQVFENADQYSIDPKRMAIGGHSAGGNLAAVTCMRAKREGTFQFVCQVLDYPPLDLWTSALDKPQPRGSIPPKTALMFNDCYINPAQARDPYVSPVYATKDDIEGLPPALFILPGRDSLHDEGLKYCSMLKAAGVVTECHEYPNALHGFTYKPSADTTDAFGKIVAFLTRYLL